MSHTLLRPFIVKVSVLGYFSLLQYILNFLYASNHQYNLKIDIT